MELQNLQKSFWNCYTIALHLGNHVDLSKAKCFSVEEKKSKAAGIERTIAFNKKEVSLFCMNLKEVIDDANLEMLVLH